VSVSRRYFVTANEQLLANSNSDFALLTEAEFHQLSLPHNVVQQVGAFAGLDYFVADVAEQTLENYQWISLRSKLGLISEDEFQLAGRALQVIRWHHDHAYCSRCGNPTEQHPQELAKVCKPCSLHFYPRVSPCIITLVTRGDECLLAWHTRTKTPRYSCLAGFIEIGESPEQTLVREVMEEVGIVVDNVRYVASQPWPFPGQLMLGYFADYHSGDIAIDPKEIAAASWFRFDQLPAIPPVATISRRLIDEFVQQRTLFHMNKN